MMNLTSIPTDYYLPASKLKEIESINYQNLKQAAQTGGVLKRWVSPKTRKVYYKSRNLRLYI